MAILTKDLITPQDLVDRIKRLVPTSRISVGTLANWRSQGLGPKPTPIALGRIRYKMSDVLAWERALGEGK